MTPACGSATKLPTNLDLAPAVARLREIFQRDYPFFRDVVDRLAEMFGPTWLRDFDESLSHMFESEDALGRAAKGYALFVMDLLRRQRKFDRDRRYPDKRYEQAAAEVYFDEEYMLEQYLPGLMLSHFLWPHHCWHSRFFDSAFVSQMRLRREPRFLEVGVGTGFYSRRVLQQVATARGTGIDISPASIAFAERHLRTFDLQDHYEIQLRDVLDDPPPPVRWLICIEVLEHLEDPLAFLRALRSILEEGGRAFVTAALNAAHVDHIYLYESVEQVLDQLQAAGFALEQGFVGAAYSPPSSHTPVPAVAAFVVS